jgi:UPF0716 protein FxsA
VFLLLLFVSLAGLADGYVLLTLGQWYGKYVVLAATASTGLIALFFLLNSVGATMKRMRNNIAADTFPKREYAQLAGLLVAGVLLLLPGFFTDALGVVAYLPPVRRLIGRAVTSRHTSFLREAYEYQKTGEL